MTSLLLNRDIICLNGTIKRGLIPQHKGDLNGGQYGLSKFVPKSSTLHGGSSKDSCHVSKTSTIAIFKYTVTMMFVTA